MIALEPAFRLALRPMATSRTKSAPRCDPHGIVVLLRRSRCDCGFSKTRTHGKYFLREKFCGILEKIVTAKSPFPMLRARWRASLPAM